MTYKIAEKKRLAQRARASRQRASLPEIVLLLIMLVVNSTPILWGLVTSLKTRREILVYPPKFFNFTPSLEHYFNVFRNGLDICMRTGVVDIPQFRTLVFRVPLLEFFTEREDTLFGT